ncbi:hypothetical protein Taro_010944 [Colocasia esculenta]|uniref:Uncharacterized protein n=1 Tax=Colocasia esculenta TaxID=4460 RepID=A0A843UEL2_COLES|nr:hypothetical protein [Colocasia esculenta]
MVAMHGGFCLLKNGGHVPLIANKDVRGNDQTPVAANCVRRAMAAADVRRPSTHEQTGFSR